MCVKGVHKMHMLMMFMN